jgi:hypothetical protein
MWGGDATASGALEVISNRMGDVMMASYDTQNLASLLDTVHDDGFSEASKALQAVGPARCAPVADR